MNNTPKTPSFIIVSGFTAELNKDGCLKRNSASLSEQVTAFKRIVGTEFLKQNVTVTFEAPTHG